MLSKLKTFLFKDAASTADDATTARRAMAVLLAEAALMDGDVGAAERGSIVPLLARRFDLDRAAAEALLDDAVAEAKKAVDLYSYARAVKDGFDYEERVGMIEMLWEVVYADGVLHDYEANLMRRLTRLLYVEDVDSGSARKAVLDRLGLDGPSITP